MSASAVEAGRQAAEARMEDSCQITAPGTGARGPLNPTTGKYDASPAVVTVYTGPCRLGRVDIPHVAQAVGGEAAWDVQDSVLHLPIDGSEDVAAGQTVTYLASDANPALMGKVFGIVGIVGGTHLTARRCLVREVVDD
jgi:hypothetical protein